MRFEWNEAKSDANLQERGFDFGFAALIFDGPTFEVEDTRKNYGERRLVAIGVAADVHLTVVYTDREGERQEVVRRIISSRRSNRREQTIYDKACKRAQGSDAWPRRSDSATPNDRIGHSANVSPRIDEAARRLLGGR